MLFRSKVWLIVVNVALVVLLGGLWGFLQIFFTRKKLAAGIDPIEEKRAKKQAKKDAKGGNKNAETPATDNAETPVADSGSDASEASAEAPDTASDTDGE